MKTIKIVVTAKYEKSVEFDLEVDKNLSLKQIEELIESDDFLDKIDERLSEKELEGGDTEVIYTDLSNNKTGEIIL